MMRILKFSLKEMLAQKVVYTLLGLNLILGYLGFLGVQFFQDSLMTDLRSKSKSLLAGDFAISSARVFTNEEVSQFEKNFTYAKKAELNDFFGMLQFEGNPRLVNVRAFSENYPIYGKIEINSGFLNDQEPLVWTDPEVIAQFGLNEDSAKKAEFKLGDAQFKFGGVIKNDSTRFLRSGGLAPVIYISQKYLKQTNLILPGSTVRSLLIYQAQPAAQLEQIQTEFYKNITDSNIKFETAAEKAESSQITFKYFSDYLGLVSIVALALCFLSAGYLFRWLYYGQQKNMAIYKILGMQDKEINISLLFKSVLISVLSYVLAVICYIALKPAIQNVIASNNLPLTFMISWKSLWITFALSILAPVLVLLPLVYQTRFLNLSRIFLQQKANDTQGWVYWGFSAIWILSFWLLAFYQSKSYKVSLLFVAGLIGSILVFRAVLTVVFWLFDHFANSSVLGWKTKYAMKAFARRKSSTALVFVTLSAAFLVLTLLPHLKKSIYNEIQPDEKSRIPALFAFDIQSYQKEDFVKITKEVLGQDAELTPMVRARILKINEKDFSRAESTNLSTREEEEENRFRNRGVNLTYHQNLKEYEKVVDGKWNSNLFKEGIPEVSLETKYAGRIGAKLGDDMIFDIQGLQIKAKVTSLRQVRWTSFNPNFFIVFQPGVLEEAPQNYLTSIMYHERYNDFLKEVGRKLPNVSIIDVRESVKTLLGYVDQMSTALQAMSIISLILGCFIFYVLLNTQIKERLSELNLLQVIGVSNLQIHLLVGFQFMLIFILSAAVGIGGGFLISFILAERVFNLDVSYDFNILGILMGLLLPFILIVLYIGLRSLSRLRPIDLLKG